VASPPIVAASTASSATAVPDGAARPRRRGGHRQRRGQQPGGDAPQAGGGGRLGWHGRGQATPRRAIRSASMPSSCWLIAVVGGPAVRRRHVLGRCHRRRQVGEPVGHRGDELLGLGVFRLLVGDQPQSLLCARDAGRELAP
jgi:hypothetical protein